jgi:hypothetical protein
MKRLIFYGFLAIPAITSGCTNADPIKLGSSQQYVFFSNPVAMGSPEAEKSCDHLGNGWSRSYFEEWTKSDPIAIPDGKIPIYAGNEGDGGEVVFDQEAKQIRAAKENEKVAVLCHYDGNLARTLNEEDIATKQKEELAAKRPKGNWQKFKEYKNNDEFAIMGVGTREDALRVCGLEYLPSVTDGSFRNIGDELIKREVTRMKEIYKEKDTFIQAKQSVAIRQLEESQAIPDRRGTGFWAYHGRNWPGSKTPAISCANDPKNRLETSSYIICYFHRK